MTDGTPQASLILQKKEYEPEPDNPTPSHPEKKQKIEAPTPEGL